MFIWGRANSINVQKVLWAADECGVQYQRTDVGGAHGGNDQQWYLEKNPNGRVPCVEDEGHIFWESNSTVRYLAAKYGSGTLWPVDAAVRSDADRWMDWELSSLADPMKTCFWGLIRTSPENRDLVAISKAAETLGTLFTRLEGWLEGRQYVAGQEFTMGDIPIGCFAYRFFALDIVRPDLKNVEAWFSRLQSRPAFSKHIALPLS